MVPGQKARRGRAGGVVDQRKGHLGASAGVAAPQNAAAVPAWKAEPPLRAGPIFATLTSPHAADRRRMADFTIYLGNKNYSSWSLRPWLVLKQIGGPVRRDRHPALRADEQGDDHEVFAFGNGSGVEAWRARCLGQPGDLRVPRRILPDIPALAQGSRCARGRPFGVRRTAFRVSGACAAICR